MDDSCAVCTDALEWVAYGPCGHREVCSTCVVRLRFVMGDRCCCICKTECPVVFVTKAMGDYTRVVADFSVFPAAPTEGRVGQYWYHEDSQAYFDDADHYRMIKAMCRLSCSVCDKNAEEQGSERTKRRARFRSVEQLKGHLFHQHKLFMCKLCLEGRKVFICEQKLYTRSQLNQHISTGDSEVDGSESERGGFMGHPMCEFCRKPFYGDHELYMHMSTEHYTCHICQRQHPGQYDYYKNYDDLEMHFRQEHFLCESEACLEKKFVAFQTEAEMKRHNTLEHGGHMSRSKRNAALRIPTSFRYRRNEQEQRRGRGRGFHPDPPIDQLSMAIQASLETAVADGAFCDTHMEAERGGTRRADIIRDSSEASTVIAGSEAPSRTPLSLSQSSRTTPVLEEFNFPPLADRDIPESSSRYAPALSHAQALSQSSRNAVKLGDESFPPLPGATSKAKPSHGSECSSKNTLAARIQRSRGSVVINSAQSRLPEYHEMYPSFPEIIATPSYPTSSISSSSQLGAKQTRENGFRSPSSASSYNLNTANGMRHSASAPNLAEGQLPKQATPVDSAANGKKPLPSGNQSVPSMGDAHTANKSLVERIRAGLGMDEDKYSAFKSISSEYRQGLINTWEYLSYVEQFGLSHLVLELAWLCPDAQKQKELIDAYNVNLLNKSMQENGGRSSGTKGKGKAVVHAGTSVREIIADNFLDTVRKMQLNHKPQEEEVEVLNKDGYRIAKDKHQSSAREAYSNSISLNVNSAGRSAGGESQSVTDNVKKNLADGGNSKQRKKTSKFHRIRLGDGLAASLLDISHRDASPEPAEKETADRSSEGPPVRGVWRSGGGKKLFETSKRNA